MFPTEHEQKQSLFRRAFPQTLPVMAGYLFLGFAYGVAMKEKGFGVLWALYASVCVYAGSMQFALLNLMTAPFAPVTAMMMTLLVNARHIFYSLSMLGHYKDTRPYKPYLIFALTDETYSLVCNGAPDDIKDKSKWYMLLSILDQSYWVTGSVLGVIIGQMIPYDMTGIDFAMTALFTVIVTEQTVDAIKAFKAGQLTLSGLLFPSLLGLFATLCSLLLVGSSSFLLVAMAVMLAAFSFRYATERRQKQ